MPDSNPDVVSLREFIDLRFSGIERELSQLRTAVERLAVEMVTSQQFERIQKQVVEQDKRIEELERRQSQSESNWRVVRWVVGAMAAVLISVAAALAKSLLGI